MGKKILVLGVGQNNFLSFLYSKLKTVNNSYTITAPFFKDLNKDVKYDSWMYDNATIKRNINIIDYAKSLIYILTSKHFYQTVFFIFFVEKKIKKAAHFFLKSLKEKAFFYVNNNFNEFDTFHFHYMQYSYLREVFLVPKNSLNQ